MKNALGICDSTYITIDVLINKRLKLNTSDVYVKETGKKRVFSLSGVGDWVLSLTTHMKIPRQLPKSTPPPQKKKAANSNQPL